MKQLPNVRQARVDREKVVNYLLAIAHPDGQSKARFFIKHGFSVESWEELAGALRKHGAMNSVVDVVESWFGARYVVEGDLLSPDGRNPRVRTVWMIEKGSKSPRLITAHPI